MWGPDSAGLNLYNDVYGDAGADECDLNSYGMDGATCETTITTAPTECT